MASSNAERQRRYRERKRAEQARQSTLPAGRNVTPPVTCNAQPATGDRAADDGPPVVLGERGYALWRQIAADLPAMRPNERVLAEEACRTADRLDVLDRILRDDDVWMRLQPVDDDGSVVKVVLNGALSEARQQQLALRSLLAEIRQARKTGSAGKPASGAPTKPKGAGDAPAGTISLAARIAAKRGTSAAG